MGDAEKAMMDNMVSMFKDADKLKAWLSSKCSTTTVEGDDVAIYWFLVGMGSSDMPTNMEVCQASDEKIRTLVTYGLAHCVLFALLRTTVGPVCLCTSGC